MLLTRGLLFTRAASSLPSQQANLQWNFPPPENMPLDARFYVDGSAMDPTLKGLTSIGYAIVVVASDGALLGVALGTPPDWIHDSAGAEAWAVYTVIATSVDFPVIVTDCLGIVNGLAEGRAKAVSPCRSLARVWSMIYNTLDADFIDAAMRTHVTWMPSHSSRHTIGTRHKSDGQSVTPLDWRANRLADAAAKAAAAGNRLAASSRILLQRNFVAYERALVELAVVTVAANAHEVLVADPNGVVVRKCLRDSAPAPRARRTRHCGPAFVDDTILPELACSSADSLRLGTCLKRHLSFTGSRESAASKRRRLSRDHAAISTAVIMRSWRDTRSKRVFASTPSTSASDRLSALRTRVACKSAATPCLASDPADHGASSISS